MLVQRPNPVSTLNKVSRYTCYKYHAIFQLNLIFNCGLYNIMLSSQVTWPMLTISANKNHHLRAHNLPIIYLYLVMRYSLLWFHQYSLNTNFIYFVVQLIYKLKFSVKLQFPMTYWIDRIMTTNLSDLMYAISLKKYHKNWCPQILIKPQHKS